MQKTGELVSSIETLTERVESVIGDHEKRLRGVDCEVDEVKLTLAKLTEHLDTEQVLAERQQATQSVKVAHKAMMISIMALAGMVVINIAGWILKALNVI